MQGGPDAGSQSPDDPPVARLSRGPGPPQVTDGHQASLPHGFATRKSRLQTSLTRTASEVDVRPPASCVSGSPREGEAGERRRPRRGSPSAQDTRMDAKPGPPASRRPKPSS